MDKFEYNWPKLGRPNKRAGVIFGVTVLSILALFLLYQLIRFIINFQIISHLDHVQTFTPKQIDSDPNLGQVNSIIELPNDQEGTVGIIKDVDALAKQKAFFKKARKGDLIFMYPDLTIIYDRENHTVVDISKTTLLQ